MSQLFLERLANRFRGREKKAAATFTGLVEQIAGGQEPELTLAESILRDAGKTTDELAEAVNRLRARRQAKATLDKALAAPAELARVAAALQVEENKFRQAVERAESERAAVVAPLLERRQALERAITDGTRAEQLLRDTATEPAELDPLRKQLAEARRQRDKLIGLSNKLSQDAARVNTSAAWEHWGEENRLKLRNEAAGKKAAAEQYEKDAAPFQEEMRRLEGEIAAAENMALRVL
jgi:hypothetical protein